MTKAGYTHISILVDRSGSMHSIASDAQGGINTLIEEQAALGAPTEASESDLKATVAVYQFDTEYEKVFGPLDVKDAPKYSLTPRGGTALNDSLYRAISDTGSYLSKLPESDRPEKVIFVVATDGYENSSREFSLKEVRESIAHQTSKYNWEFIYLGANVDTDTVQKDYGYAGSFSYKANAAGTQKIYRQVTNSITSSRVTGASVASTMVESE